MTRKGIYLRRPWPRLVFIYDWRLDLDIKMRFVWWTLLDSFLGSPAWCAGCCICPLFIQWTMMLWYNRLPVIPLGLAALYASVHSAAPAHDGRGILPNFLGRKKN
jgi:hypothetical protein